MAFDSDYLYKKSLIDKNHELLKSYYNSSGDNPKNLFIDSVSGVLNESVSDSSTSLSQWHIVNLSKDDGKLKVAASTIAGITAKAATVLELSIKAFNEEKTRPYRDFDNIDVDDIDIEEFEPALKEDVSRLGSPKDKLDQYISQVNSRISTPEPLSEEVVSQIHSRFFQEPYNSFSRDYLNDPTNPVYIISSIKDYYEGGRAKSFVGDSGISFGVNQSKILYNSSETPAWIFKPSSGECESHVTGIELGKSFTREVLASSLNYNQIYPIPKTLCATIGSEIGSIQQFKSGYQNLSRAVTLFVDNHYNSFSSIPLKPLQASVIFDIIFNNADRHLGNLMISGEGDLIMVDHGLILSESPTDCMKLEQIALPQMTQDWDDDLIKSIDFDLTKETEILSSFEISPRAINRCKRAAQFIKLSLEYGLRPYDVSLIAIKCFDYFWNDDKFELIKDLISKIPDLRKKDLSTNIKIIKARQDFLKTNPQFSEPLISCLFGAKRGEDYPPGYIHWYESILGKAYEV